MSVRRAMKTAVCTLLHGAPEYYAAGAESASSVLRHTPFPLFVAHDRGATPRVPSSGRVTLLPLDGPAPSCHRAQRFLLKLDAMRLALDVLECERLLLLDADAVFVRPCRESHVDRALGDGALAMVEQPTVTGSPMSRVEFLEHYVRHSLALLAPGTPPPHLDSFRYFNSGVVIGTRAEWDALVGWALRVRGEVEGEHEVGEHMVADQDYLQVWAHTAARGRCRELPWYWNHCEHWHPTFPRAGALIAHFSNFCNGPADGLPGRMRALQRGRWFWWNRVVGGLVDAQPRWHG